MRLSLLILALAVTVASCSSGSAIPQTGRSTATVQIRLLVPRPSPSTRKRQYISPATQSVFIDGFGFNTTPSSPNCTTVQGGLQCTLTIDMPVGNDGFAVTAYDQPLTASGQSQGNQLSTGSMWANIVEGTANVVKITLFGTPAKAKMSIADPSPPMGTPASIPINLTVYDADGYAIVGQFSSAVQLTAQNAVYLDFTVNGQSSALVGSPSDVAAISYPGYGTVSGTISANVQDTAAGTYLAQVPFTPHPAFSSEMAVGTSLVGASAWRDGSYQHRTWFTEPAKHKVATYPQGGPIAEFGVASGASLLKLTATATYIYATESNNSIALWSTGNTTPYIIEQPLSAPNVGLYQIGGADSGFDIYFTEKTAGKIGKLAGSTLTELSTGNPKSTPAGIAWFNGTAWIFADPGANAIGIVTDSGGFTYYPVPTTGAKPTDISANSNGGLWWFTEPGASKIGSIDANGNIAEYGSPGVPQGIVTTYTDVFVLTTAGKIEDYDPATGALRNIFTPPASPNGPAVGIFDGGSSIIVLRSDGTNGSIQEFYYT